MEDALCKSAVRNDPATLLLGALAIRDLPESWCPGSAALVVADSVFCCSKMSSFPGICPILSLMLNRPRFTPSSARLVCCMKDWTSTGPRQRFRAEAHADKLFNHKHVGHSDVQHFKKSLGVIQLNAKLFEAGLHLGIFKSLNKLLNRERSRFVGVRRNEQFLQLLFERLIPLRLLLHHEFTILLGHLDRVVHEDSRDDVQCRQHHAGNEQNEDHTVADMNLHQGTDTQFPN